MYKARRLKNIFLNKKAWLMFGWRVTLFFISFSFRYAFLFLFSFLVFITSFIFLFLVDSLFYFCLSFFICKKKLDDVLSLLKICFSSVVRKSHHKIFARKFGLAYINTHDKLKKNNWQRLSRRRDVSEYACVHARTHTTARF